MFRAAYRSSSEAQTIFAASGLYTNQRLQIQFRAPVFAASGLCTNQWLQIQFRAPDDKRCAARNMLGLK
jgi:hypothetical protein